MQWNTNLFDSPIAKLISFKEFTSVNTTTTTNIFRFDDSCSLFVLFRNYLLELDKNCKSLFKRETILTQLLQNFKPMVSIFEKNIEYNPGIQVQNDHWQLLWSQHAGWTGFKEKLPWPLTIVKVFLFTLYTEFFGRYYHFSFGF